MNSDNSSSIHLGSARLDVEIAAPGSLYAGSRFDWTAFITQVTLDHEHTFCVPESYEPGEGTQGCGLCNEFGIDAPVGYDDAAPGELFPKLGIGLLRRADSGPYNFAQPAEIVKRFPIKVDVLEDQAVFVVDPIECRGYALRMVKTVGVQSNRLRVTYSLENVGTKPVKTLEYCHNFIGLDRKPLDSNLNMSFPYPIELEKIGEERGVNLESLEICDHQISPRLTPDRPFYLRPLGWQATLLPQWKLTDGASGLGLTESDDFAPVRVAVWGTTHVISAEVFVGIHLQPGQSQHWARTYEFFNGQSEA